MTTLTSIIPTDVFSITEFRKQQKNSKQSIIFSSIVTCILSLIAIQAPFIIYLIVTAILFISWYSFTQLCVIKVAEYRQKYNIAWNDTVKPQMIQSVAKFDQLSNTLPENQTSTPKYIKMHALSEQIRQEIQQGPELTTHTNFDATPNFIKLNNMMNHYTQNPA